MNEGNDGGADDISTECLKALDESGLDIITDLFNRIYDSGYIPDKMNKSIFVTIPEKPNAQECSEHRTISLMSHLMKLLLRIILERISEKIENEISDCQSGFRPRMGTR